MLNAKSYKSPPEIMMAPFKYMAASAFLKLQHEI